MKKRLFILVIALMAVVVTTVAFWSPLSKATDSLTYFLGGDPDLPLGFSDEENGDFDKEEFQELRAKNIARMRGIVEGQPFDVKARPAAIVKMEEQEQARLTELRDSDEKDAVLAAWTPIGPAPIPNGQTTNVSVPVSGRTTAIAIHPTNPNIVYVGTAMGGLYRSTDGGINWTPLMNDAQSLAIGAVAIAPLQPDTIYVGTGEGGGSQGFFGVGIYRIDNASTANPIRTGPFGPFTGTAVSEIIVHPTNPAIIFASSASGVGGIRATGPAVADDVNVFRSVNATSAAPTFTKFFNGSFNVRDLAIDPTNPEILLATFNGLGVIRISNAVSAGGGTPLAFTQPLVFGSDAEITSQRSVGDANATFYVARGEGNGRVSRSTDGGVTWTTRSTTGFCGGQCFYNLAIAVDPTNANNVYVGGQAATDGVITARSIDGGATFTARNNALHADTHAFAVAPSNPLIVYTGNDGGIFKSIDGGLNYVSMNTTQFSATQFIGLDVHPTDPNFTLGGTQDNGTNFFQPTATWRRADFGDGGFAVIDQNAPDTVNVRMYHTYFNVTTLQGYGTVGNVANAMDFGWAFRGCQGANMTTNGITCNGVVNFYAPLERGPGNPNTIYYGSDRLYRSDNLGVDHTVVSQNPIVANVPISSIGISPQNDNVRITGLNNGGVYGTSTGANVLVNLDAGNTIPNRAIARTIIDPNTSTTAYVTLSAFGVANVWKTTNLGNAGTTWADSSGTGVNILPQIPVNAIVVDPMNSNYVYVGTDIGVYLSTDGGANWKPFGTGLPRIAVFNMEIVPGAVPRMVRIATHGQGMFQTPVFVAPTAAAVTVAGKVTFAKGFGLSNSTVSLTDSNGETRSTRTSSFGFFKFEDVQAGETYTVSVEHKRYTFNPQVITVTDNLLDLNLIPQE